MAFVKWMILLLWLVVPSQAAIRIVAVDGNLAWLAQAVGGDRVQVTSLTTGSINMHTLYPKPSMITALQSADMIIRLGMDQDTWVDSLIQTARNPRLFSDRLGYVDASQGITPLEVPVGTIDGRQGDVHPQGNPHYLLNPLNGIIVATTICDRLARMDPDHAATYYGHLDTLSRTIRQKMPRWKAALAGVHGQVVVSHHKTWPYFLDAFSLPFLGTLEPVPGISPTIRHLHHLRQTVAQANQPVRVISARYYPKRTGERFAESINAPFHHLPTTVGDPAIDTYPALFDAIIAGMIGDDTAF
jgi:zinc/manganese transport system substrate-binding protein